jgi:hypothetical protein
LVETPEPSPLERFCALLAAAGVEFMVVGGQAEALMAYEDLLARAETVEMAGQPVRVIGLDDLIRIKRHLGRPKDRESLLQLEAIKRLRDEEGLR